MFEVASSDLVNMGITVVSYTLKDIRDDEGYLKVCQNINIWTIVWVSYQGSRTCKDGRSQKRCKDWRGRSKKRCDHKRSHRWRGAYGIQVDQRDSLNFWIILFPISQGFWMTPRLPNRNGILSWRKQPMMLKCKQRWVPNFVTIELISYCRKLRLNSHMNYKLPRQSRGSRRRTCRSKWSREPKKSASSPKKSREESENWTAQLEDQQKQINTNLKSLRRLTGRGSYHTRRNLFWK